ncbi:fucolectin-like [Ptychodera flava]|uniref:fucolectin-like n=1 Tax=Ptychodera flava TaxID=63121 RepID=UPI003969E5DD
MEGTLGHIVSVQIEGQEGTLNLCEVEVYGTLAVVTQQQITTKESEPPSTQEPQVPLTQPPQPKTEPPVLACELPPGLHNVAQGKPAFQSSDKRRNRFGSENAVDGNFNTNAHKGSCSWTKKEYQPWWQVDLGDVHSIYEVVITNREDYCPFRLINAEIRVGTNENFFENPVCGMMITGKMIKENPIHVRCGCEIPLQGRYVSVQLIDKTQMLTLCEIEVMAA